MKKALIGLMFITSLAHAQLEKSPTDMYDMTQLKTTQTTIKIVTVDNIRAKCDSIRKSEGFGAFPYPVSACTVWPKDGSFSSCTIYIGKKTNNDILGHEVRHCFAGNFH